MKNEMIEAAIFDMDGLLIDSEPMWKAAESSVFTSLGVDLNEVLTAKTATMTTREVAEFWYSQSPWAGKSLEAVEDDVITEVKRQILAEGTEMPSVSNTLEFFKERRIAIGLATNSPFKLISVVFNKLGIADYFDAISSSEFEARGKPAPDVYVSAAKKLGKPVEDCLAFEDSFTGLSAAKEAGMKTVVVPCLQEFEDPRFDISDLKLRSLAEFDEDCLMRLGG
ncbi:hexitol phosphatase HxpB [Puniceicoccaceae bacterium K14]|nr:hexitol phosphatase HxpB [Puniceicoccaceae bacterium K14]